MTKTSLVKWAAVAALLAAPRPAIAQTKDECLASFELGQEERDRMHLRAARAQFAVCARVACPAVLRQDCAEQIGAVARDIPTLVLGARDATGADVHDVQAFIDGERVSLEPGGAVAVDPGAHTLRFEHPPYAPQSTSIVARLGEKNRLVLATFFSAEPGASASPVAPSAPPPAWASPWPWVATGIGVAGLASFSSFAIAGNDRYSTLADTCGHRCSDGDVSGVRTRFILADVSLGIGIVSLAVAAYLFLKQPSLPPQRLARSF